MNPMRFVFRTDCHVTDKSPQSWKGDYTQEVFESLRQVGQIAKDRGATAVLDGGDYFHVKASTRNPHWLVERTAQEHRAYPCPVYCVEGNHDMAHNRLESIVQQPLGVLYATNVFQHLRESVFVQDGLQVRVVGVPYSPNRTVEELRQALTKQPGDTHLIGVVHQLASMDPPAQVEDFFGEPVFRYEDLMLGWGNGVQGPDCLCFGHWHRDQGITPVGDGWCVNHGALSRGALNRENLDRTPKVALLEVTTQGVFVESIPLSVAPAQDVFDLERKDRVDREAKVITEFVAKLREAGPVDATLAAEEALAKLAFARDVRESIQRYLDKARAEMGQKAPRVSELQRLQDVPPMPTYVLLAIRVKNTAPGT